MKCIILSGGPAHDYDLTSAELSRILEEVGIDSRIQADFGAIGEGVFRDCDMIALNCARWSTIGQSTSDPQIRDKWSFELSEKARNEFLRFFADGKGLLALHAATLCFDDWSEYARIVGATFTGHAPYHQYYSMHVCDRAHPITTGLDDFIIKDELYTNPSITDSVEPLIDSEWEGRRHPILWVRNYGAARICYNALGHDMESFENPTFRELVRRGALWVTRRLEHQGGIRPSTG